MASFFSNSENLNIENDREYRFSHIADGQRQRIIVPRRTDGYVDFRVHMDTALYRIALSRDKQQ